ncbi:MAG: hypothetical protein IPM57_08400 [Oligoflexia bacterium]|nr:hypothetical protein [Oligoflexia bacterium]
MKSILLLLLTLSVCSLNAEAITNCESILRQAYAESSLEKVNAWIFRKFNNTKNVFSPDKIKWGEVKNIVEANQLGTQKTSQWLASFYERAPRGQITTEEVFAFYGIINPKRGLEVIRRLEKTRLMGAKASAREKIFFNSPNVKRPWLISLRNKFVFPNKVAEKDFNEFFISFVQATQPRDPWVLTYALRGKFKKSYDEVVSKTKLSSRQSVDEARHALAKPVEPKLLAEKFGAEYEMHYQKAKEIGMLSDDTEIAFSKLAQEKGLQQAVQIWKETKDGLMATGFWHNYYTKLIREGSVVYFTSELVHAVATDEVLIQELKNAAINYYYSVVNPDKLIEMTKEGLKAKQAQDDRTNQEVLKYYQTNEIQNIIREVDGAGGFNPFEASLLNHTGIKNPQLYPCDPEGKIYLNVKNLSESERENKIKEFQSKMREYTYTSDACLDKLTHQLRERGNSIQP